MGVEALTQSARCSVVAVEEHYRSDPAYADEVIAVGEEMGVLPSDTRPQSFLKPPTAKIVVSDDLSTEEIVEDVEEFLRKLRNR